MSSAYASVRYARFRDQERASPSVKFSSRQNDNPEVPRAVVPDELTDGVATQRSGDDDHEDFEGDDC